MVSALTWQAANTSLTLEGNGSALTNDTIVEANDNAYNGDTVLATFGWLELVGTWATAPSDSSPSVNIYKTDQADGTNYEDAPVTGGTDVGSKFLAAIPVRKVTSAQRIVVGPIALPPHDRKFYCDNQTGQTLGAGWTLKLLYNNLEGQ